jgi:hypothetical protein
LVKELICKRRVKIMKILSKKAVGLLIVAMLLAAFVPNLAYATNSLELEISYEWATDGESYSNSVAAGDIDGDSITEMVTVGYFRNSSTHFYDGELDVWSWNGTDLSSELAEYFHSEYTGSNDTRFNAVALGNVDNETDTEIIVAGQGNFLFVISITPPRVAFQEQGLLFVGSWNGSTFTREDFVKWPDDHTQKARFLDLAIGDLDKDNDTEIVAVGAVDTTPGNETDLQGVITIWSMTSSGLNLETSYVKSITGGETIWRAVTIDDVDNDGELEIVIVGDFYDATLNQRCAVIRICTWDGSDLAWETSSQWFTYSDTYATDVAVGDIDSDGIPEIITSGYQRSGESVNAQIRVWTWYEEVLTLKSSVEGGVVEPPVLTLGTTLAVGDVDDDGKNEIILGVIFYLIFWSKAHIRVFAWEDGTLIVKGSKDWEGASYVQSIVINDVDNDGKTELITAGYSAGLMVIPTSELAIWSVSKIASSLTLTLSSSTIVIGESVKISGTLTDETGDTPIPNTEITLEYSIEPLPITTYLATVRTNENGEYTFTWEPPRPGNYLIIASWKGNFEHEGTSVTAPLTVEKASSLLAIALSSYAARVGDIIHVNGTLYPAKATQITMEYTLPNGTIIVKTVDSNNAGTFSDTFTADPVGAWNIKASWTGDDTHAGTESLPLLLSVSKIQSALEISASPLTVNLGEEVAISGTLMPGQTTTVTITYTMPNGTVITKNVATSGSGVFTDTIKLNQAGVWQIKASWNGNEQYEASTSVPITVVAQAVDQITPILAMAGLGAGLIALILAAIGVMTLGKKAGKQPTPSPPPTEAPPST